MKKLLLDECLPHSLRELLTELETYTVAYMQWDGIKNGKLMQLAVDNNFDILITTDKNLKFQQNMDKYPITIVVFDVVSNKTQILELLIPTFKSQIANFEKHKIYIID